MKFVDKAEDGKDAIFVASQDNYGFHYTLWGKGIHIHIYEDECELTQEQLKAMAEALEKTANG